MAQCLVAVSSELSGTDLSGLEADGRCPRQALQATGIFKAHAVRPDLAEQAWSELWARAWQGAKEIVVGMLGEEFLDLQTVSIDLALESAQHAGACQRQPTFGTSQCFPGDELVGPGKDLQTLLVSLRAHQAMGVQELLPFALA